MEKFPFVVFSLALVLSVQFVVGQDEKALDEATLLDFKLLVIQEVAKLVENFKSSAGDDSQSVDWPTFSLADEIAASSESEVEVATESNGEMKRKRAS
ncbi:hypothetical protein PVK06_000138 [Gossypium arboreum]|uniref:Uncharacterized protein n=1 Tax=Gossypium arboreum TaxID=29729 RepID=A0ABR0QXE0_GOSAR|nr:hypothetical protein PVK06_000138 [Gossypium arboreum]